MSAPIKSLPEWLNTATENLSAPAQERIKLEIESHFEQAMENHRGEGLTESQAQVRALTELGDARAAAKSFRKSYLTATESKVLDVEWNRCRSVSAQCLSYGIDLLGFGAAYYCLKKHHTPLILPGVLVIMILTFRTICLWVARRPISRSRVRLLFTLQMLALLSVMMLCGFYIEWNFGAFIVIFALLIRAAGRLRLWLKIQRADDFGRETPPPSATVS